VSLRFLQANVGNINVAGCNDEVVKLCLAPVEDRTRASIARLRPEIMAIQETLPDQVCSEVPASSPSLANTANLCAPGTRRGGNQVDRLLPPQTYDTRCNSVLTSATYPPPWDCLAVDRSRGSIVSYATLPAVVGCDNGFTVNIARVRIDGRDMQVTSAHPESGTGTGTAGGPTREQCRAAQLSGLFATLGEHPELPTIVSGDFNLDPYRRSDVSIDVWHSFVGLVERPYLYRSGAAEDAASPPLSDNNSGVSQNDPTGLLLDGPSQVDVAAAGGTLDHVAASHDIDGPCTTLNGTGPGRDRLDGGGGMDHKAISCALSLAAVAPALPETRWPALALLTGVAAAGLMARRGRRMP